MPLTRHHRLGDESLWPRGRVERAGEGAGERGDFWRDWGLDVVLSGILGSVVLSEMAP